MNVYFAGIGGVGIGPLAEITLDAGHSVRGSNSSMSGLIIAQLSARGVAITTDQSGDSLSSCHQAGAIDWFVYTSAMPADHPEVERARLLGIAHIVKRDEFINVIVAEKQLKMIAVAGTHGKTTTTAMLVWTLEQLGIPVSYSIGTTISFGPSGKYTDASEYFIYECDEFDRNFLSFNPALSLMTSIGYDHPDTYPTLLDYQQSFTQFMAQSRHVIAWAHDIQGNVMVPSSAWKLQDNEVVDISLAGAHNRANATLVTKSLEYLKIGKPQDIISALESFPGSARRFEKLADGLYSDYGHHPAEIAATLQLARELSDHVVLVYQPHQNTRQHQIRDDYTDCMVLAENIYWLPTYLTREDSTLPTLSPEDLTIALVNRQSVVYAQLDDTLWSNIVTARSEGKLVLCMGAGTIDEWIRQRVA